jgi:uncharacterized protein (TIGR02246 family)
MGETMTAREGIQELYARYPIEMDRDNAEELADCFTPDGLFLISGQGRFEGTEEIKALVPRTAKGRPRHLTVNLWIREVNGDEARCEAYFLLIDLKTGATVAYGTYTDRPVRGDDDRWRFKERRVQFEWTSEEYAATREPKAQPLETA